MRRVDLSSDWNLWAYSTLSRQPLDAAASSIPDEALAGNMASEGLTVFPLSSKDSGVRIAFAGPTLDDALIASCRGGSKQAFNTLVFRYKNRLYTLAVRLLGDQSEAEDITQETFLRAYEKIEEFRGEALFSTWLYRICYNQCLNCLARRKNDRGKDIAAESHPDSAPAVPDQLLATERQEQVRWAITQLKQELREVIVLYHTASLSYEEIADLLRLPVGTVRSRLHRGREQLKELLRPYLKDP